MSKLRFALIGSSGFATTAGGALARSSAVDFAGVLGSTRERGSALADKLDVACAYRSLEELLADPSVDAVWLAAHDSLHAPMGVACMKAGKHLLVEKPMATSVEQARALLDAATDAGVVLRVGCHQRYRPAYRDIRTLIAEGALGEVGFARLHFFWEFEEERVAGSWRASLHESGGSWVVKEFGAHLLDLLCWWLGRPVALAGADLATQRHAVETDDSAALLLQMPKEAIGIVQVSTAMAGRTNSVEIHGGGGWLRAHDVWRGNGTIERSGGKLREYSNDSVLTPYLAQLEDFAGAVGGDPSSGADGVAGVTVLEIVEQAIELNRRLRAPDAEIA